MLTQEALFSLEQFFRFFFFLNEGEGNKVDEPRYIVWYYGLCWKCKALCKWFRLCNILQIFRNLFSMFPYLGWFYSVIKAIAIICRLSSFKEEWELEWLHIYHCLFLTGLFIFLFSVQIKPMVLHLYVLLCCLTPTFSYKRYTYFNFICTSTN